MERWTGVLGVPLSRGGPLFRVAASLILAPSKSLAVPRVNAILFTGDSVRGTGDPAIERLSDAAYLAGLLAGKLAGEANAWVVDAACFAGPFAVYRELVPSMDTVGDPERYDPNGLPAADGVANILTYCIREVTTHGGSRRPMKLKKHLKQMKLMGEGCCRPRNRNKSKPGITSDETPSVVNRNGSRSIFVKEPTWHGR